MVTNETLNECGAISMSDYFDSIFSSYINQNNKEVRVMFKELNKSQRKDCIKYIRVELESSEIANYLTQLL